MKQSPEEANNHTTNQEIPHLLWNLKVQYYVCKSLLLVPILSQMNPVHTFPPCFAEALHTKHVFYM
jgi:hypothetical protein